MRLIVYAIDNLFPFVNFMALLAVLYVLQQRTARFQRIERDLDELKKEWDARTNRPA